MSIKRKTAAQLLSLDALFGELLEDDNAIDALTYEQKRSWDFACDFIPSVFAQWITAKRDVSPKQLNKIQELYSLFDPEDYDEYMEDERIKDI